MGMAGMVVYTALLGGYENLNEVVAPRDGIDYVCFTDDPALTSDTWRVVQVDPMFPADLVRSQRMLKILGHPELDRYDRILYVDNSVRLSGDPRTLVDYLLGDADLGFPKHSFHHDLGMEFGAVWRAALEDPHRIAEQWDHYEATNPEIMATRALWCGLWARTHSAAVHEFTHTWACHVLRYARRDQLSLPFVVAAASARVNTVELDNHRSEWHEWPILNSRLDVGIERGPHRLPPSMRQEVQRYDTLADLRRQVAASQQEVTAAKDEVTRVHEAWQHDIDAIRSTLSWRITRPLRLIREISRIK